MKMYDIRCPSLYFSNKSFNVSICFKRKIYFMHIRYLYDKGDLKKIIFVLNDKMLLSKQLKSCFSFFSYLTLYVRIIDLYNSVARHRQKFRL